MEHLLTKLKTIEPGENFKNRSRALILSSPRNAGSKVFSDFLNLFRSKTTFALATIFVFMIIGGLSLLDQKSTSPTTLSNLDPEKINEESEKLDIQIQLSQAKYYENSAEQINVALNETSDELKKTRDRKEKLDQLINELTL